jgi:hypothetical protein
MASKQTDPDLLRELEDAAHDLEYLAGQPWARRSEGDKEVARNRAAKIRAALAKARGEDQDAGA